MRLVFAGTPAAALPALDALLASSHDVVAVLTRPAAPTGRGRRMRLPPVAERAISAGLEVLAPPSPRDAEFLDRLRTLQPDCCPVVGYGALVPPAALAVPSLGWVNLHFSLLPAWRGAAPVQHALLAGDEVTGATVFRLVPELDAGPVLGTLTESIRARDTAGALQDRLASAGASLLVATLDAMAGGDVRPQPQPRDGVSLAPKIGPEVARVRWSDPAFAVDRRVRACTPEPGAWTTWNDTRVHLGPVLPQPGVGGDLRPGELRVTSARVHVGTATDAIELGWVRPSGRHQMSAADWARGARPSPGARLDGGTG